MNTQTADAPAVTRGTANGCRRDVPSPDFVVEHRSYDPKFIVGPCHRRAADWLHASVSASAAWVGEGVAVDGPDLQDLITSATAAGFAVALGFQRRARIVAGSGLSVAVH